MHLHSVRSAAEADALSLTARFAAVRTETARLASPLSAEDCALQSMPDASPVKWHLAHTTWFFETFVVERFARDYRPLDRAFRVLFNSYYNGVGEKHPRAERGLVSRPDLATVRAYRLHVEAAMQALLRDPSAEVASLIELGINHEQQHQELILTDVLHLFSRNPTRPAYRARPARAVAHAKPLTWTRLEGGLVDVGHDGKGFAFDNEMPRHRVFLAPFELASRPVSTGEFAAFIADGGYRRPELWLSMGWDTVVARGWQAPLYWEREGERWRTFTLHGFGDMETDAPVRHVSFFEADAYARWAGARLPTEFEWEHAADAQSPGDVWEWTRSEYAPYPGFCTAPGAVGEYNGKFMCGQYVLRGGSFATPRSHIRTTYRNFFPPDARWQFSGLRLARDPA